MVIKLTELQLIWICKGRRWKEDTIAQFRLHYVDGMSYEDVANKIQNEHGKTRSLVYKNFRNFDAAIKLKLEEEGLEMAIVFFSPKDKDKIFALDISEKK